MIKIKFPSPTALSNKDWFEQMELAIFHAKKSYEKFTKDIEKNKHEDVSIRYGYPEMIKNSTFNKLLENEDIPYDDTQEIEFIIDY